jgi:hypothetical protein
MLNERVCFIETKLEDLSTMRETLDKPTVAILANYPARTAADQELIYLCSMYSKNSWS